MLICENLLPCPICNNTPNLIRHEFGSLYELSCNNCELEYGAKIDPQGREDVYYPSDSTYIGICEIWNVSVSKEKQIPYVEPIFKKVLMNNL